MENDLKSLISTIAELLEEKQLEKAKALLEEALFEYNSVWFSMQFMERFSKI